MDEFLQDINSTVYLQWILMQNNLYNLNIKRDNNVIMISNDVVEGRIIYYGRGIFEEELTEIKTGEKIYYLHFQLYHYNHAVNLFKEMINCAMQVSNKSAVKILLCCSGGLTTTLFASKMKELADLENKSCKISATGYTKLFDIADDYDLVLLAPQVAYLLPQVLQHLHNKKVIAIPPKVFASNDYSAALKMVYDCL